jgi:hypothetical protein
MKKKNCPNIASLQITTTLTTASIQAEKPTSQFECKNNAEQLYKYVIVVH